LLEWEPFASLSTSDFAGDGTRLQSFRHGEAPEEERELRILALAAHKVELYSEIGDPLIFCVPE
jgi:hypothetical protein